MARGRCSNVYSIKKENKVTITYDKQKMRECLEYVVAILGKVDEHDPVSVHLCGTGRVRFMVGSVLDEVYTVSEFVDILEGWNE